MKNFLKKVIPLTTVVPLIVGSIGYIISGEKITDALYDAVALYTLSHISDGYNLFIEIARWTAPLVTATAILSVLKDLSESIKNRVILSGNNDCISVYSDSNQKICFKKKVRVIYPGDKFKEYSKCHMIMFSTDDKNLQFYEEHKTALAGKETYIGIRDIESCFLKPLENVTFFDVNSSIARMLWKEIALWNQKKTAINIVIWGNDSLASGIICTGLQMNLFSNKQKINYCFVTDNNTFQIRHSNLNLMNDDGLTYLDCKDPEIWNAVTRADIIILADLLDVETMQTIVVKSGEAKVYYYSPVEGDVLSRFSFGNIIPFGRNESVLMDENIRRDALIKRAKNLNDYYKDKYKSGAEWDRLSGLLKGSNISAADFGEVLAVLSDKLSEDEQAELEHIRWCRYMFLNYYSLGEPENGQNRDDDKRIHRNLIDYCELSTYEQEKDKEAIKITKSL